MTTATIPTTLAEYHKFVRAEALKVQADMGWPDDKLNETLRALGLPEKQNTLVPIILTGKQFVLVNVPDAETSEEAKAAVANASPEQLATLLRAANASVGRFGQLATEVVEVPTVLAVGDLDVTMANHSVYQHQHRGKAMCEHYQGSSGQYCTLPRGHEGQHIAGNGTKILAVWDQD